MNYDKLAKAELLKVTNKLKEISQKQEKEVATLKEKLEEINKEVSQIKAKNTILVAARKEDKEKIEKFNEVSKEIESLKETLRVSEEALAAANRKNEILTTARKEDKEKIEKSEQVLAEYTGKESELAEFYNKNLSQMNKMVTEQNETIVNLFDMMDNTINLQLNYYQKYKNLFISVEKKEE